MLKDVYIDLIHERVIAHFPTFTGAPYFVVIVALLIISSILFDKWDYRYISKTIMSLGITTKWTINARDLISDTTSSIMIVWNEYLLYARTVFSLDASLLKTKSEQSIINDALVSIPTLHGVPSIIKSIDCAILILSIARLADGSLANNVILDDFFSLMNEIAVNISSTRDKLQGLNILCIEGQSCSGKSTLVLGLVMKAGAVVVESFDSSLLSQIRILFSKSPEPVMTALEYALNYCTAYRIVTTAAAAAATTSSSSRNASKQLVIVDEFYHSVCARTVCTNVGSEVDLKCLPASAFEWPLDLPTPTLVKLTPIILWLFYRAISIDFFSFFFLKSRSVFMLINIYILFDFICYYR